ncbi:MAG: hypothetical protein B7Z73_16055 [Planctomycetia bacterium 21-64-5]|nr:MAG: hypothetical protein B7Z73_16055 [Planctomycetia bacterium 21-64-5]HQU45337.1 hypothetical protein [Pirellulales bacterium]
MNSTPGNYFQTLATEGGRGWNRFWFAPSDAIVLAALRISVGLMAFYLLATYTLDLGRYFGEQALVPLKLIDGLEEATRDAGRQVLVGQVREAMPRQYRFSYLDNLHGRGGLMLAHVAGMVVVGLFTAGCFTRITAVGSLVVFLSYLHRAPMLTSGVEPLVAVLLFYLCLGPSGACCSVDRCVLSRRKRNSEESSLPAPASSWATVALRLIQVHLTLIYAMMAVGKLATEWWWNGIGVWLLIARTESRMIDLSGLHQFPLLINAWSYAVLFWQSLMPIFIWNRLARPLLLAVNAVMWIVLAPVIGNFPLALTMIAASLAFVSPSTLRRVMPVC